MTKWDMIQNITTKQKLILSKTVAGHRSASVATLTGLLPSSEKTSKLATLVL